MYIINYISKFVLGLLLVCAWGALAAGGPGRSRGRTVVAPTSFRQAERPSLEGGLGWVNSAPIRLEELRGKVVLLDFWTYCCINCHHVLPDLARLERKYTNELVVIGVHTPKFFAERDTENLRKKVREYQIKHPVINDADQVLWNRFGANSWPTLVLIDPSGEVVGSLSGEGHFAQLDHIIGVLVARHRARGDLNETPIKFFPESEQADDAPLSFPGKVLADAEGKRLFIADTVHNRIVRATLDGKRPEAIGTGVAGLVDGGYAKAEFNRPQGLCLVDKTLYVADTENHAIRAVDLAARTVTTVAGNGKQTFNRAAHGPGKTTSLTSPWDLVQEPGARGLFVAMAGQHQIWRYDIDAGTVGVWAGTGGEDIIDGPIKLAAFAQPSGLATDGRFLYVADSETSSVRAIALEMRRHVVQTIVGEGLFVFGDVDGQGDEVRLQHDLGLASGNGKLYIADSYNNKIKVCDPKTRTVETLAGSRQPGDDDASGRFYQPGGLSLAGSNLYVADTNNSKVRVIDLKTKQVRTLELEGLRPPAPPARKPTFPNAVVTNLPQVRVAPGKTVTLDVALPLPGGFKLNEEASMPYLVEASAPTGALDLADGAVVRKVDPPSKRFSVTVDLNKPATAGDALTLKLSVSAFVCAANSGLCQIKSYVFNVPIAFASGGAERLPLAAAAR